MTDQNGKVVQLTAEIALEEVKKQFAVLNTVVRMSMAEQKTINSKHDKTLNEIFKLFRVIDPRMTRVETNVRWLDRILMGGSGLGILGVVIWWLLRKGI